MLRKLGYRLGRVCSPTNRHRLCYPGSTLRRTLFVLFGALIVALLIATATTVGRTTSLLLHAPSNCTSPFVDDCNCFSRDPTVPHITCGLMGLFAYAFLAAFGFGCFYFCRYLSVVNHEVQIALFSDTELAMGSDDNDDRDDEKKTTHYQIEMLERVNV